MVTSVTSASTGDRAGARPYRHSRASEATVSSVVPTSPALRLQKKRDRRDGESRARFLGRVRSEFGEMPCMRVTCEEAARLFGLRPDICARVLEELAHASYISKGPDGRFSRLAQGL